MKAAVYYKRHDLRVEDVTLSPLNAEDIRIKIAYCGVCGTDLHIYNGDGGSAPVNPGTIIGHEIAGVVSEVGKDVKDFVPGDRVTVDPNEICGACYFCRNAQGHFCEHTKGYGTTYPGGFAEYITMPQKQVFHIPDSLSLQAASQSETLSCCVHGIDLAEIKVGQSVFIIGAGPIGQMMIQLAALAGAGKIIVSEPVAQKREMAKKFGATTVIDPAAEDVESVLHSVCNNIDCVIECVGSVKTVEQALRCAGKKCTVLIFGLAPPEAELSVKPFSLFLKETKLVASFINPYTFNRAIALLAGGKVRVDEIITDIVPLSNINSIFEDARYRSRGKILVEIK